MRVHTKQRVAGIAAAALIGIGTVTSTGLVGAGVAAAQPNGSSETGYYGSSAAIDFVMRSLFGKCWTGVLTCNPETGQLF